MRRAPDLAEAVIGWRAWLVRFDDGEPRLVSPVRGDRWVPREPLVATCPRGRGSEALSAHKPASAACGCGVHATRAREEALAQLAPPSRRTGVAAVGRVALWGQVVAGDAGWRAGLGYPVSLELHSWREDPWIRADLAWIAERLATDYGVPVVIPEAVREPVWD